MIMQLFKEHHYTDYLSFFDVDSQALSVRTTKCHDNVSELSTNEDLLNSENTDMTSNYTSLQQIDHVLDSMIEEVDQEVVEGNESRVCHRSEKKSDRPTTKAEYLRR